MKCCSFCLTDELHDCMSHVLHTQVKITKTKNSNPSLFRTPKLFRIEQIVVKWEPNKVVGFLMEKLVFHETFQLNTTFETQSCFS